MIKFCALILFCSLANLAVAQQYTISGTIRDTGGQPVPFASVYLKNTTKGTSANIDGKYAIKLNNGEYTLSFRAVGYKQQDNIINLNADLNLDIKLSSESYTLENVTIKANAEDPAYAVIRQAIKKRKEHLNEVNEFACDVYIKGVQRLKSSPKKFMGRDIKKVMELDTNGKGIIYLSESQSKFNFKRPNAIHEEMISSKIAGRNNAFSFNKASDLVINFYDNYLLENKLSTRGFISPIADNALFYYKYKSLGESEENGVRVHKIQVIPRRENDPVFRGIIYIIDNNWRIYNTDLFLTKSAGINFIDTLNINQQFTKVDDVYMPISVNFQFNGDILNFKFAGYFIGIYSNYNLNPKFPKNFFNGEILKVTKLVNKKDSIYWSNNRPIPLTLDEKVNYVKKDSLAKLKESKKYLDSLEKENNKFGIGKLLLRGVSINDRYDKEYYTFDPVLRAIFYNTVEGLTIKYGVTYKKVFENNVSYSIRPEVRYGFANQKLTASLTGNYLYNPLKRASVGGSFGNGIFDMNNLGTMTTIGNMINTLLYEKNFPKFYEKSFVNINTTRELATGLQANLAVDYNKNHYLTNSTNFKLFDNKDREFTSNNPFSPNVETPLFPTYTSVSATASLTYTFGQKYITRPDGKFYTESKYPRITILYKKGINGVLGSDIDYDFVKAELFQDRISLGLWGYTSFLVGAGKFLNNSKMYYLDYKHFKGNISTIFPPNLGKFQYLDFYQFSTNQQYFEAHLEHNFAGFFLNKVPLLRKAKLEEFMGGGYLSSPEKRNYKEFYFGIQRLVLRASYGFAYDGAKKLTQGFRISYGF
ncbi:carboxypeptidase-like regulatory domain-containing protein [Agrobacterium tumefaciens]|nr:carboxypeptidase-like regulatory domain-containing protein [Agrobacterium tumefaciens]NTE24935.1 carboxypeptidase-like regulatory domain-containing protein [Agrobacterium tumefaciens]